jgi:hypothetical protein
MRAIARAYLTALLVPLVAPSVASVTAAPEQCAKTAHMQIYSSASVDEETGDLLGYELAVHQRKDSAIDALLYVYEGAANDDGILISGSISGKKLTLTGKWVEHLTEYPSKKEIIETHSVKIDGTLGPRWFRGRVTIEGMMTPDKVELKRVDRLWFCKN